MKLCKHQLFAMSVKYTSQSFEDLKIFLLKLWELSISPSAPRNSPNFITMPWTEPNSIAKHVFLQNSEKQMNSKIVPIIHFLNKS